MKLYVFLLSAGVSSAAAFLRPKSTTDTTSTTTTQTQLQGHATIDSDYLQTELAAFANEKLASGYLPSTSSFETSTMLSSLKEPSIISSSPASVVESANDFFSSMVVNMGTGNPLAAFHESATNVFSATSAQWDVSSSVLASNLMSTVDFTPEVLLASLVPSMIMMTSMAVTILVSGEKSLNQATIIMEASPVVRKHNELLLEAVSTDENEVYYSAEVLEEAFTPAKFEYAADPVVASSAAAVACANSVLASTTTTIDVAAEEIGVSIEPNVAIATAIATKSSEQSVPVVQLEEEKKTTNSSLFSQASRMVDSIVMKVTKWLFQGQQFFRYLLASVQKFQKSTVSTTVVSPFSTKKPVLVQATKFPLSRTLTSVKNFFADSRQQRI